MRILPFAAALFLAGCTVTPSAPVHEIAPKGALRIAVGVGPSPSPFWTTRDPSTGSARGVTVELGRAAAAKLGVPAKIVEYPNSGEIMKAASQDAWDISFMPQDPEREKYVDVGPAYVVYESSYLVGAGSSIRNAAEVDQDGVRVGGVEGTTTSRAVAGQLKHAKLALFPTPDPAMEKLAKGELDAIAMGREALIDFSRKTPGTRLLDDIIQSTGVVVVVPKNRPATREWAARFVEEAKANGTVRRALDAAGFTNAAVAPPVPKV